MANGKRAVTLGVLGSGDVAKTLVCDTLNDHFAFGPEDTEGYFGPSTTYDLTLLLPAGGKATSPGVHATWEWAVRCELPYRALWDESGNAFTADVLGNVEDAEEDVVMVDDVGQAMVEHLVKAENPMLLVISEEGGEFDADTEAAAAAALREGVPVHDLARALLEVSWRHLTRHEPPQEAADVEEEPDGQLALTVDPGTPEVTLTPADAAAVNQALLDADQFLDVLAGEVLDRVEGLRTSLVRARSRLAPKPPEPETPAEPKKTRLEIFNPSTGRWEPAGRGRPPKGAQKRRVPA